MYAPCAESKRKCNPFPRSVRGPVAADDPLVARRPLEKLHIDISGPREPSAGGNQWFTVIMDDATLFEITALHMTKGGACDSVIAVIKRLQNLFCKSGHKVAHVRWDRDTVFHSSHMQAFFSKHGIVSGRTSGHSPQENGNAERAVASLKDGMHSLLADSGLHGRDWAEALLHYTYIDNISSSTGGISAWEQLLRQNRDISHLYTLGLQSLKAHSC